MFVSDGAKATLRTPEPSFRPIRSSRWPIRRTRSTSIPTWQAKRSEGWDESRGMYGNLVYLSCTENGFIPPLPSEHVDLIYLCNPNNPTGAVMKTMKR